MPQRNRGQSGYTPVQINIQRPAPPSAPQPQAPEGTFWQQVTEPLPAVEPNLSQPGYPGTVPPQPGKHVAADSPEKREPVPGRVIPQQGLKGLLARYYRWRNLPDKQNPQYLRVPTLGTKE